MKGFLQALLTYYNCSMEAKLSLLCTISILVLSIKGYIYMDSSVFTTESANLHKAINSHEEARNLLRAQFSPCDLIISLNFIILSLNA